MNWPSISIVIPSFNQSAFIERTLQSVMQQDYPGRVQVIVSDGGSTDGTIEILQRHPEIEWWSKKDSGFADAVNRGLVVANGEIVGIQSSDDFYLRDAFRLTIEPMIADPELAIASGCDIYLQPDSTYQCSQLDDHEITPRSLLMRRVIPQHCAFFRRPVIDKIGGLRTQITEGAEIDFWYRTLHFYRGTFVPHHTAAYQVHPQQRSKTSDHWYRSMVMMVETCESDEALGSIFKIGRADKRDLYARWEILQERRAGRTASEVELIDRLMESPECTDETLQFLMLQGLIPRVGAKPMRAVHPNHRVPELDWYLRPTQWQQRAVA